MSAGSEATALVPTVPIAPSVPSLELERLRREVKARLFGSGDAPLMVDRYRILGCIGQGGMGIVYAARDERLGRTVALKLLRPELSRTQSGGLAGEAQSLAKLSHPNVVAVFDVGEHDGQVFVAMEFVEGQSLRRWLATPRSLAEILDVYLAAGEGLAAAHKAGLVHRDFKPDNVLVGADRRPRILDFGLARAPDREHGNQPPSFADDAEPTATSVSCYGVLLGTPAYMAPEQHLGERSDARSDQFGFCVALYQAIYRALPFPSEDLRALSLAIVTGRCTPPPTMPGVPDRLRRLILRGLSVCPDDRYPEMDTLLAELRELRAGVDKASFAEPEHYDTRAIERAFGLSGSASPASSGRPSLTDVELREIADEVGLELHELSTPEPPAEIASRSATEHTQFGLPTTILAERMLPAVPNLETQRRIVRELERNLGGTGIVEQFEAGMAWANSEAEASIDRCPGGARLSLRRSFARLARKRRRRGLIFGGIFGTILGGIIVDPLPVVALEPLFVFTGTALGLLAGTKFARKLHERHMNEERALLGWLGERVAALVEADSPSMRMLGESKRG
ncbi:MAG TPA: serine/threonine-protein kinase [Enhygromyxa sp.]|nr:serine/threonine-protein kinase [Enhygromyxa sp.]